jgi:hypothetical protein
MMADGSLLRSGGETWGPVSPKNVEKQVTRVLNSHAEIPQGRPGHEDATGSAKVLGRGPNPSFCALQDLRSV